MRLSSSWKQFSAAMVSNEEGNSNISEFSLVLNASNSEQERAKWIAEDVDTVILTVDHQNNNQMIHNPILFDSARSLTTMKMACFMGMGSGATYVEIGIAMIDEEVLEALEDPDQRDTVTYSGHDSDSALGHVKDVPIWTWGVKHNKIWDIYITISKGRGSKIH
eukprot:5708907-Ditylum_brightwellii.AAC.1